MVKCCKLLHYNFVIRNDNETHDISKKGNTEIRLFFDEIGNKEHG